MAKFGHLGYDPLAVMVVYTHYDSQDAIEELVRKGWRHVGTCTICRLEIFQTILATLATETMSEDDMDVQLAFQMQAFWEKHGLPEAFGIAFID